MPTNCGDDPTKEILLNINSIAYADLNKERNTRWMSDAGKSAMVIMQLGMQYYMFA